MRFRSAGLGQMELKGRISDLAPVGKGLLVLHIETHDPVKWHLKAGLERRDIPKVIRAMLRPSILFHIIRAIVYAKKNPKELKDIMDKSIRV